MQLQTAGADRMRDGELENARKAGGESAWQMKDLRGYTNRGKS